MAGAEAKATALGGYRLEDQVGFYLRRAAQRHAAIFADRMTDELTPTQWAALVKLAEFVSLSQNLLGRETAMDAATHGSRPKLFTIMPNNTAHSPIIEPTERSMPAMISTKVMPTATMTRKALSISRLRNTWAEKKPV